MHDANSIPNSAVGLYNPPFASDDLLVPTLHNVLGNLNPTQFCEVIAAVLETRADQHFEGHSHGRVYTVYSISTDDKGWVSFSVENDVDPVG